MDVPPELARVRHRTTFKPGVSGNPGGRPQQKALRAALRAEFGKDDKLIAQKLRRFVDGSVKGQTARDTLNAIEVYLKWLYGAPLQSVSLEGEFPDIRIVEIVKDRGA